MPSFHIPNEMLIY